MSRRRLLIALFLLVTGLLLALSLWLHSSASLHWLLARADASLPGQLQVERIEGNLLGPVYLGELHYRSTELDLRLQQVELDWQLWQLFTGKLAVEKLAMRGLQVRLHERQEQADASPPPTLAWPLRAVEVTSASLEDIQVYQRNQTPFHLDSLALQGRLSDDTLSLEKLAIRFGFMALDIHGRIRATGRFPLQVVIDWTARRPDQPLLRGSADLAGDLTLLTVEASLLQPAGSHFSGQLRDPLSQLRWQGGLDIETLELASIDRRLPALVLNGQARLEGSLKTLRLHDSLLHTTLPESGPLEARLDLDFSEGLLRLNESRFDLGAGNTRLWLSGQLDTRRQPLQISARGHWTGFRWPLQGGPPLISSAAGKLNVEGHPDDWHFQLRETAIDYGQLQSRDIRVKGRGDRRHVALTIEQAHLLDGQVSATARLSWADGLSWQAELMGEDLDPSSYPHDLTRPLHGRLAVALQSRGDLQAGKLDMRLALQKLSGKMRNRPVSAHGKLHLHEQRLEIDDLKLDFADMHASANGSIGRQWNLDWQLMARDISPLLADARGQFSTRGHLSGPRERPRVQASLSARKLRYAGREGVEKLQLDLDVDLAGMEPSHIKLRAHDLDYRQFQLSRLELDGSGNRKAHQLRLDARTREDRLNLSLAGRVDADNHWRGQLQDSHLQSAVAGDWQQQAAADLDIARHHFSLTPTCWASGQARLCTQSDRHDRNNWLTEFDIQQVPLALFQPLLPGELRLHGDIDGKGHLQIAEGRLLDSRLNLQLDKAALDLHDEDRKMKLLDLRKARLTLAQEQDGRYRLDARMDFSDAGFLQAGADLEPVADRPLGDWPLQGRLHMDSTQLNLLHLLYPALGKIHGRLVSDLRLTGSAAKPVLSGELGLRDASIGIPALGLELEDFQLALHSPSPGELDIEGQLRSDGGILKLDGQWTLDARRGWPGRLRLYGEDVRVVNLETAMVRVSPDMTIRKQGQLLDIQGTVAIPEADIRSVDVPASVPLSGDVVFVDETARSAPPKPRRKPLQVRSRVEIVLGEAVHFEGYGLRGRLAGKLEVTDEPGQITTGQGNLHIVDGQFNAFGVDLKIDIGRILFTGGAISDPGISATATRKADDVTVGVRIRGALRNPQLEVFSIPSLPENEAMSYLLFGRKMTNTGISSGDIASSDGSASPLTIGTFLSPRTYVDYVVGALSPTSVMRIRFKLNDHWELQAESASTHTAADAVYSFEK